MFSSSRPTLRAGILIAVFISTACKQGTREPAGIAIAPAQMARVGTVDERFQSYNVEMLEVTGGKFWKPYGPELEALLKQPAPTAARPSGDTPAGMNPGLYEYRPPLDLTRLGSESSRPR